MDLSSFSGKSSVFGLDYMGFLNLGSVFWNLSAAELVEQIILRGEGKISRTGSIVVNTSPNTGRSPHDKYFVRTSETEEKVFWGDVNQEISSGQFSQLLMKLQAYLQGRDVYIQDMAVGADPNSEIYVRVITEKAWQSLVSQNLFIKLNSKKMAIFSPAFTVIAVPGFLANPTEDGINSSAFIVIDLSKQIVLIGGTAYAGEIKKSVFTFMNYLLPQKNVLPMHCAANVGKSGDVALFFGLSGTGKTTLSSDNQRQLIGDDEHGWSADGIFNFEGGCYAKTIRLHKELEPIIWRAAHQFGTIIENVVLDPITRNIDFDNSSFTENTRAAYPLEFVEKYIRSGCGGHPNNIFFLSADAFGVLPPLAKLNIDQAVYYFLSGYTAKIAGTESGINKEPVATFSSCFAAPFLPMGPAIYAAMFADSVKKWNTSVWLINTGWTGGSYGYGTRIPLAQTRSMISAVLDNSLTNIPTRRDEYFNFEIPVSCPNVQSSILNPVETWKNKESYSNTVNKLIYNFHNNFNKFCKSVPQSVLISGPVLEE